ncbi:MAG: dTDP-4-dehydrorhamnose 3,5-epimerase [Myxococcales bacterium]|nr:dTDP-4-dehydrorhamnose 3,5-epimerase [Myxococcales bacterium]
MKTLPTTLPGVLLFELDVFGDQRGRFMETYRRERYRELGVELDFVQDNFSSSSRGVLRGLHYQLENPQGKLVHVTRGEVFDVAVDIRVGSPTFGQWFGALLSADNHRQMWIPPGFAHGFLVTSEQVDFAYKVTAPYSPSDERALAWNDPQLNVAWPLQACVDGAPTLSARDRAAPLLAAADLPRLSP